MFALPPTPLRARTLICLLGCGLAMLVIGALSLACGAPLLFPAIGASAFLAFFAPRMSPSHPRNMVLGHALGAGIGSVSAALFGVAAHCAWLEDGTGYSAVFAASLALALTGAAMTWFDLPHPPAGATTLIVATGLMGGASDLLAIVGAALSLSLFAYLAHRLTGEPYPAWRIRPTSSQGVPAHSALQPAAEFATQALERLAPASSEAPPH